MTHDARPGLAGYAWAAAATALCTGLGLLLFPRFDAVNIALLYLLAVVIIALRYSHAPAITASVLCMLAFNYFFIPPRFTFSIEDPQYLLSFAILLAVALIVSTLTDRTRTQAREQAALEVTAETERIRSTLLASISHDLRTPLTVLSGASSTLAERGERMSSDERQSLARSLFQHSSELANRVSKVLQMTRLESGGVELRRDWADPGELVSAVLSRLAERLSAHRVLVELRNDLPLVRIDSALMEQALSNLLENAAQHTPEGTVVMVRAALTPQELVISVEDSGPGLPDGDIERIFAKFDHGRPTESGVGLGLTIARAIVRLHGGRAWAECIPGGGIAFRLSLPREAAPMVAPEADPA